MPYTIRCINCKKLHDVAPVTAFNLSCECGTVIKRLEPYKRIEFDQEKYNANVKGHNRIVRWKNAIDNAKLVSIGAIVVIVLVTILGFLSYVFESHKSSITNIIESKPYVHYEDGGLYIDDFDYSFGKIEINKPAGNFQELNSKVYNLLKDQNGSCKVYIKVEKEDKYGNKSSSYVMKGTIDVSELKKYSNADHWSNDNGMERLLLH